MQRFPQAVFVLLLACIAAPLLAQDEPKTGKFTTKFTERSPLSEKDKLGDRIGIAANQRADYNLEDHEFFVYVPKGYKPDGTFGLVVYLSQNEVGAPFEDWFPVLDKHQMLWVGANNAPANQGFFKTLGLALDAAHNIGKQYQLAPSRTIISGLAGGMGASILAPHYPDEFGGGLYMLGSRFYKNTRRPGDDGAVLPPEFRAPDDATLETIKTGRRFVWVTGAESTDIGPRDKAVFEGYKAEGFTAVEMIEMPGVGNVVPTAEFFDTALTKLEELSSKTGQELVGPDGAPIVRAEATPVKTGLFQLKFDKRSPHSDPRNYTRLWKAGRVEQDYNIANENFHVYVPRDYEHGMPYGLVVYLTSKSIASDTGAPTRQDYHGVLEKQRLIWVGAGNARPDKDKVHRRLGLALDAVENMKARYTIDEDRIYVAGAIDGGISASQMILGYPEVFNGALLIHGAGYYRDLGEGNKAYLAAFGPPSSSAISKSKAASRIAFISGGNTDLGKICNWVRTQGFEADRFRYVKYIEIADLGQDIPGPTHLAQALEALDEPLKRTDRLHAGAATRFERAKQYEQAWMAHGKVVFRTDDDERRDAAQKQIEGLRAQRDEQIVAAKAALADGNQAVAKGILEKLLKEYGRAATDEPQRLLAELEGVDAAAVPDAAATGPSGSRVEELARRRLNTARATLARDLAGGYQALRDLASQFGQTAAGKQAAAEADKLWNDPDKRKQIESLIVEREAGRVMLLARRYLNAGDTENAREKLTQIIEDYPGSSAAEEAKKLLDGLKGR